MHSMMYYIVQIKLHSHFYSLFYSRHTKEYKLQPLPELYLPREQWLHDCKTSGDDGL